jgi:hypothetical protein
MSESTLTPQTAPRDLNALMQETPFKLRLLLNDMGQLSTDDQKMAWHALTNNEGRATHVFNILKAWDAANPGQARPATNGTANGAMAPQPMPQMMQMQQQQPMQQPPQQPQMMQTPFQMPGAPIATAPIPAAAVNPIGPAQVSQQAAAAATAATAGEKTSTRKPRTTAANAGGDADLGAQVVSMLQTILTGLGQDVENRGKWQTQITSILEEAATGKASRVTALEQKYGEMLQTMQHISSALQAQQNLQIWTIMAFLTLAEQQTGAGTIDILRSAISDSAMFQKLVDSATGKAG